MKQNKPDSVARRSIRWGLYPASWIAVLFSFEHMHRAGVDPRSIWGATAGGLLLTYLIVEFVFPYERRWSMTWRSFLADIRYVFINGASTAAISAGLALFTISLSGETVGPASDWPELLQLGACLLIFEAINYTLHRAMHELRGPIGRWLWWTHAAHHLPPRLYLVMHAVFHPFNGVAIQVLAIVLPIWVMGYDPVVVAMFLTINGMHGLLSHFNVDVRMGWANYLFVGTELHRYHHSADIAESRNYGATLSIFDQLFGTFVYRPGQVPKELGVSPASGLPDYGRVIQVLLLPFRGLTR